MADLQREVGKWGEQTFPDATDDSIMQHLREELGELDWALAFSFNRARDIAEEAADCYMMLLHIAHRHGFDLETAARDKLAINRTRTWDRKMPGGYVKHTKGPPR